MNPISWPTDAQTWVATRVHIPGLAGTYDARIQLGRAEAFDDGWLADIDEPTMTRILDDLAAHGDQTSRLLQFGWTIRRHGRNPVELVDANGMVEDLDQVDDRWLLPRHCGIQPAGHLPPLARLYRSLALLEAYAYGPTNQVVDADELTGMVGNITATLGTLAGAALGHSLDADNPTAQAAIASMTGLLGIDLATPAAAHTALTRLIGAQPIQPTDRETIAALRHAAVGFLDAAARELPSYLPSRATTTAEPASSETVARLVRYNPHAARRWLIESAADEYGIDDGFSEHNLTIVAGLDELLSALNDGEAPDAWETTEPVRRIQIWRTADGDGIDGGGLVTADLSINGEPIRIATHHQSFDDFTIAGATSGIDAAVAALGHVAELINREGAPLLARATTQ